MTNKNKTRDEELKEKLNIYGKFPNGMTSSDFYDYIQNEAELKGRQEREQEILKIIDDKIKELQLLYQRIEPQVSFKVGNLKLERFDDLFIIREHIKVLEFLKQKITNQEKKNEI